MGWAGRLSMAARGRLQQAGGAQRLPASGEAGAGLCGAARPGALCPSAAVARRARALPRAAAPRAVAAGGGRRLAHAAFQKALAGPHPRAQRRGRFRPGAAAAAVGAAAPRGPVPGSCSPLLKTAQEGALSGELF